MKPKEAWGRVQPTTKTELEQPKDVFSRNPTGYPMWTEAMKAAIGQLRQAGRKWYSVYDKMIDPANLEAAWDSVSSGIRLNSQQGFLCFSDSCTDDARI